MNFITFSENLLYHYETLIGICFVVKQSQSLLEVERHEDETISSFNSDQLYFVDDIHRDSWRHDR